MQVIPYEAFILALVDSDFDAASSSDVSLGTETAMAGNDPNIFGLYADVVETEYFSGDVFIVLLDPVVTTPLGGRSEHICRDGDRGDTLYGRRRTGSIWTDLVGRHQHHDARCARYSASLLRVLWRGRGPDDSDVVWVWRAAL